MPRVKRENVSSNQSDHCFPAFRGWACFSKVPANFRARKVSWQNAIRLLWKADHSPCFLCKENQGDCNIAKFDWLRTSALRRYKGNCGTRNRPLLRNRPLVAVIIAFKAIMTATLGDTGKFLKSPCRICCFFVWLCRKSPSHWVDGHCSCSRGFF